MSAEQTADILQNAVMQTNSRFYGSYEKFQFRLRYRGKNIRKNSYRPIIKIHIKASDFDSCQISVKASISISAWIFMIFWEAVTLSMLIRESSQMEIFSIPGLFFVLFGLIFPSIAFSVEAAPTVKELKSLFHID